MRSPTTGVIEIERGGDKNITMNHGCGGGDCGGCSNSGGNGGDGGNGGASGDSSNGSDASNGGGRESAGGVGCSKADDDNGYG